MYLPMSCKFRIIKGFDNSAFLLVFNCGILMFQQSRHLRENVIRGEPHIDIWRHNDARGWGVIANDVLKMRKVIEFQSSRIANYYKIHFRVLLQPICAGEVSVVIVIDK